MSIKMLQEFHLSNMLMNEIPVLYTCLMLLIGITLLSIFSYKVLVLFLVFELKQVLVLIQVLLLLGIWFFYIWTYKVRAYYVKGIRKKIIANKHCTYIICLSTPNHHPMHIGDKNFHLIINSSTKIRRVSSQ